jgi:hypothetical protein
MAYNAVAQREQDALSDEESTSASPAPQLHGSSVFQPLQMDFNHFGSGSLFMEHEQNSSNTDAGLSNKIQSMVKKTTGPDYEMLEEDDYTQVSREPSPAAPSDSKAMDNSVNISHGHESATAVPDNKALPAPGPRFSIRQPIVRTASGRRVHLQHPTPDLQSLQGAYTANVQHLEKKAEKLSMTSSIEDAIRQMHDEQKRSDSRRSSLLASPIDMSSVARQFSNSTSILEINSAARSGGYSPGGFNMVSSQDSFPVASRVRSASKGSRFGSRQEPELEGRPLDHLPSHASPHLSRSASIAEEYEDTEPLPTPSEHTIAASNGNQVNYRDEPTDERPATSASANTFEQAQKLFSDFDGEHYNPRSRVPSDSRPKPEARRISSANLLSTARPMSYADPHTGTQMVYYPAPVPMMLNLPQKLSKQPSAKERETRRSQILSSLPPAARKSAIWLPDVLEDEGDRDAADNDVMQNLEFEPQHHRRSMGGRKSKLDLEHIPPQLRASTFFEGQGLQQTVEVKGESAVNTLDSILDASAFAPVSAFTDHAFAGRLGAEVYGTSNKRASRPMSQMPGSDSNLKNRKSLSNLLLNRRASSSELLNANDQRRSTMSGALGAEGDEDEDPDEEDEGDEEDENATHPDDVIYHGAPTTLLAELQIRKQQQKQRTRPITAAFPNGVHSTLLELDAVAQVEKKTRKQRRVALAWEDPHAAGMDDEEDDDDVPLGMLFAPKSRAHQDVNRPMGLMEKREMEDNEPLSQRRDRLLGRPRQLARASTMIGVSTTPAEDESETLAQRIARLKAQGGTATGLPNTRPVSGDFTSELMSQFGGDAMDAVKNDIKGKGKEAPSNVPPEEEETLGQRRKRLQAEREARSKEVAAGADAVAAGAVPEERPILKKKLSMADILTAHPAAAASRTSSYNLQHTSSNGLLGMHERQTVQRSSTMPKVYNQEPLASTFTGQQYNPGMNGMTASQYQSQVPAYSYGFGTYNNGTPVYNLGGYAQQQMMMPMAFTNPYASMGYGYGMGLGYQNPMAASMLQMQGLGQELNQGQIDMVERWRQSVMQ